MSNALSTTNFPNGVSNVDRNQMFGLLKEQAPETYYDFKYEMDKYATSDWIITKTEAGSGSAAIGMLSEFGGVLQITNDNADNDNCFFQYAGGAASALETFKFFSGKQTFFEIRCKLSDVIQSDFFAGLQITDTTPLSVSDGVYFIKNDGAATVDLVVVKNGTATTTSGITTMTNSVYVRLGYYYDGVDQIRYYVDGLCLGASAITNLPDDEELTISFGIQNGEAAAKSLFIDYITAKGER